ncbi:DUF1264 domain-containing protein [Propioniciclava soli]|uniref:DUF1264 domain-containing protein n=1 Tax=Propioniciclava soli TaxID=2775081 RepID=UPI001E3A968E|nr:DUF1264 domain-containing protein [Propioniciclava soli]
MSTYLNGLHMYADEMGRQVEASHFCIHLRHAPDPEVLSGANSWESGRAVQTRLQELDFTR